MSITSRSPLRVAGANINSGNVFTGEQLITLGGGQRACFFSGMASGIAAISVSPYAGQIVVSGADVLIVSGGGRLKTILPTSTYTALSGVAIYFYDAGVVISGGPFPLSGHAIVGVVPGAFGVSGQIVGQTPIQFDIPFNSGLCMASKSGQVGVTVTFLPETIPNNPG
jgi:hypothetical protein